jgi:DNA-binding transcriptional ArsR family regulator
VAVKHKPSADERTDHIDRMLAVWSREIPALDRPTEGIVERIDILARYFNHSMETTLAEFGLDRRTHRVLGRLKYQGPPYRLSAGQLAEGMGLSSGAMTNRLDRLESAGLVRRLPGREALIASALTEDEKEQLHGLLRRLMRAFPDEVREGAKRHRVAHKPKQ